jgi:molybdopterin converting factor small subunit
MGSPPTASDRTPDAAPRVVVRYWAAARAAAGLKEEAFDGHSVGEVLDAALDAHRGDTRFADVLRVSSLLLGERPLGSGDLAQVPVGDGDVIEVLPPFAGG